MIVRTYLMFYQKIYTNVVKSEIKGVNDILIKINEYLAKDSMIGINLYLKTFQQIISNMVQ